MKGVSTQQKLACQVGSLAPDFSLSAVDGNTEVLQVTRSAYAGRWLIIIFYPRDFSFVCPTELTGFSAKAPAFDERDCDILGVGVDSIETHREWLFTPFSEGGVEGLRFPLASDPAGQMCQSYGVWREDYELPNRDLFLIDPDGLLRYSSVHDLGVGRNVDDTLRVLDALKSGGLCPVNWTRADGVLDVAAMLKPGRVLGNFRIERELGRGTFGSVMAADDLRLKRKVALKVVFQEAGDGEAKLLAEARSAAAINHPNVCSIYAVDEIDGLPTIAMEYLEGPSLEDIISTRMSSGAFQAIGSRLALGLAAAHDNGVVHGDLKPGNVILRTSTDPVIVDFGLARSLRATSPERPRADASTADARSGHDSIATNETAKRLSYLVSNDEVDSDATVDFAMSEDDVDTASFSANGGIFGTPAYMSPEQAIGNSVEKPSDVFSLGLILHEMLTGTRLPSSQNLIEMLDRLQRQDYLDSLVDRIPDSHREIIAPMLLAQPVARPSAETIAQLLMTSD